MGDGIGNLSLLTYLILIISNKEVEDDEQGAAKVYFDLRKGKIVIMNMELRYKGGFTSQPQFFGTLSKQFKDVLKGQCVT